MPDILIVDDDNEVLDILYDLFSERYECRTASTADKALQYLEL